MALTRAQLLMGNDSQGAVLPGEVQGVKQGAGILIATDGTISVDASSVVGLVKLNNASGFNGYVWPSVSGSQGQMLTKGTGNLLEWTNGGVFVSSTAPLNPEIGDLWFNCTVGELLVYEACTSGAPKWTSGSEGLPVTPSNSSASPAFVSGNGTSGNPYICSASAASTGGTIVVNRVTITNLAPFQFVTIVDLNAVANGGRFSASNNVADGSGVLVFDLLFTDSPTSVVGTVYTCALKVGYGSVYINAPVTLTAAFVLNSPGSISGTGQIGSLLTYTTGTAAGGVAPYTYSWVWKNNLGATLQTNGATYTPVSGDFGNEIFVTLTATDFASSTISGNTNFIIVSRPPFPNPTPPVEPTNTVSPSCQTWDGAATTLSSDDCLGFSVNGSIVGQGPTPILPGDTLCTSWLTGTPGDCAEAPSGTTIAGCLFNSLYSSCSELTVNRVPNPITFTPATAPINTVATSNTVTPTGFNSTAYVTYTSNPNSGTNISASTNGATFTLLQTSGTSFPLQPGQTLTLRFTTGPLVGTTYNANISIGQGTNVITSSFVATTVASGFTTVFTPVGGPTAIPYTVSNGSTLEGVATGTWVDGNTTLTSTDCLEFSVNSTLDGSYSQASTPVADGDIVRLRWKVSSLCGNAATGTTIDGDLTNGSKTNSYSFLIDRVPGAYSIPTLTDQSVSTSVESSTVPITGINSPTYLTLTSSTLTSVSAAINSGSFTVVPPSGVTFVVNPGDSLKFKGTTGAATSTSYNAVFALGGISSTWVVTTATVVPTVATPQILSPNNGSQNLNPVYNTPNGIFLTSTGYTALNTPGTHASTDWETYRNDYDYPETAAITSFDPGTVYSAAQFINYSGSAALYQSDYNPTALFSGTGPWWIVGGSPAASNAATVTFPTPFTGVTSLTVLAGSTSSSNVMRIWINGVTSNFTTISNVPRVYTITVPGGVLTSLSFGPGDNNIGGGGYLQQITVNGVQLLDTAPTITLGSGYGLGNFNVGDVVIQDDSAYPGDVFGGGYYAGKVLEGGTEYDLIISPKATGQSTSQQNKDANTSDGNPPSQDTDDGSLATAAYDDASHPAYQFASGLSIGGFSDWYIPAINELNQLYYYFKPDNSTNSDAFGSNPIPVPARANYAPTYPGTTIVTDFVGQQIIAGSIVSGPEAMGGTYGSSSEDPSNTGTYLTTSFSKGAEVSVGKTSYRSVRAVRKVLSTLTFNSAVITGIDRVNNVITLGYYTGTFSEGTNNYLLNRTYKKFNTPIISSNTTSAFAGSTLTLANALNQGFRVGDVVSSTNSSGTGTISAVSNTSITLTSITGTWTPGGGDYVTAPKGTIVNQSLGNTTDLTFYIVPKASYNTSTGYSSRVRYNSTGPSLTSNWSSWDSYGTSLLFTPLPGSAFEGGFYAGYYRTWSKPSVTTGPGIDYYITVSNKALGGQITGCYTAPSTTPYFGGGNAIFYNFIFPIDYPSYCSGVILTNQALGQVQPNAVRALSICSCRDWYTPTYSEMISMWENLKPGTAISTSAPFGGFVGPTNTGSNTVPPNQPVTTAFPGQTSVVSFQTGGSQQISYTYWSSVTSAGDAIRNTIDFDTLQGFQGVFACNPGITTRAVRRTLVNGPVALGAPYCGGLFAGQYAPGDCHLYNLIVAPVGVDPTSGCNGQQGGSTPTGLAYGGNNTTFPVGANDMYCGKPVTVNAGSSATYPLFQWANSVNTAGGIGGKIDWYIPSLAEWIAIIDSLGPNWTNATAFKPGGSEVYSTALPYWTTLQSATSGDALNPPATTGNNAWAICASTALISSNPPPAKSSALYARLMRSELVI